MNLHHRGRLVRRTSWGWDPGVRVTSVKCLHRSKVQPELGVLLWERKGVGSTHRAECHVQNVNRFQSAATPSSHLPPALPRFPSFLLSLYPVSFLLLFSATSQVHSTETRNLSYGAAESDPPGWGVLFVLFPFDISSWMDHKLCTTAITEFCLKIPAHLSSP